MSDRCKSCPHVSLGAKWRRILFMRALPLDLWKFVTKKTRSAGRKKSVVSADLPQTSGAMRSRN